MKPSMIRFVRLVAFAALISLIAAIPLMPTSAQQSSPAVGAPGAMSQVETQTAIDAYLTALVAREDIAPFFSDDIVLELVDVGQEIQGRDAVAGAIVELHEQTFDARPELANLLVGEGTAAVEAVFVGTHTGEFVGIPATGWEVAVPYAVFYDLADGEITALRIHGFASGLVAALTAEAAPTTGTPTP
jgi:predicted ester cyclase